MSSVVPEWLQGIYSHIRAEYQTVLKATLSAVLSATLVFSLLITKCPAFKLHLRPCLHPVLSCCLILAQSVSLTDKIVHSVQSSSRLLVRWNCIGTLKNAHMVRLTKERSGNSLKQVSLKWDRPETPLTFKVFVGFVMLRDLPEPPSTLPYCRILWFVAFKRFWGQVNSN